jgi:alpha-glucosidase (family GH31 glycosyl hydrolase)
MTGFDCGGGGGTTGPTGQRTWTHPNGNFVVTVSASPFAFSLADASGNVYAESTALHDDPDPSSLKRAYAPVGYTHNTDSSRPPLTPQWNYYRGTDDPWKHTKSASAIDQDESGITVHVDADGPHPVVVRFEAQGLGLHMTVSIDGADGDDPVASFNRLSVGFAVHADRQGAPGDHFLGFGERYVYSDHLGKLVNTVVEDDGFGHGEGTPIGPGNPSPSGPEQTHIPIPWFMSPRGFGMFLSTPWRAQYHLGDDAPDAWRVETWNDPTVDKGQPSFDATFFADPDPMKLVEALTAITGRPPAIADYVIAPRRRVDECAQPCTDGAQLLRNAHIPTSVIDLDDHYFPNGGGSDSAAMQALTSNYHTRGFKVVAYFCPFVADSWHPVFDDAVAKGYLVKHADGTAYTVLDPPYNAGMVDFTNPDAVKWYQGFLQQALDDGWDGWMYDFAEYVPLDAVMFDGTSGAKSHDIYTLLYQKAMFDLLEQKRHGDYLVFARSGYAGPTPLASLGGQGTKTLGTGGLVPMVWAGDQATDFDLADGLPAALIGALNVGMSGMPLWGSDISGYHYIFNPPPDKELYLRWTEVGAFSADMHDENNGAGSSPGSDRWQIWKDQESTDTYRTYATYKTRMIPYVKLAVAQARKTGAPVMRHLFLEYPRDPNVWGIGDEYMYGDSLLVAPVVTRGSPVGSTGTLAPVTRQVYLPEPRYFDFFTGARVAGGTTTQVSVPLDSVPVYAKIGAIVPMYAPEVETVFPSSDGSVISAKDREDFREVAVFAGGQSSVTLDDGTVLSQSAPTDPFTPGTPTAASGTPIPQATSAAALRTCGACWFDDPTNNVWSVAVRGQSETVTAGALTVSVASSPIVRTYLFSVRH